MPSSTRVVRAAWHASIVAALLMGSALSLEAQARLAARRAVTLSPMFEGWSFGDGIAQPSASGGTVRISSVSQLSIPIIASFQPSERLRLGISGAFTSVGVSLDSADAVQGTSEYRATGFTDLKLSLTAHIVPDRVLVTLGINVPTGLTELDGSQLEAVRVISAPALGAQVPALGVGRALTGGIVLAQQMGGRAWALGASYEARGSFAPIGTTAGLPTPEFTPSDVLRLSLSSDGLIGQHGMTFGVSTDLFSDDHLTFSDQSSAAATHLGPIITADWQLRIASTRLRALTLSITERYRTGYRVGGSTIPGSSGNYFDAGLTAISPLGTSTGLVTTVALRHHTGLGSDESLVSAAAAVGALTLGLEHAFGGLLAQPFVRLQAGRLETGDVSANLIGFGAGIAVSARF